MSEQDQEASRPSHLIDNSVGVYEVVSQMLQDGVRKRSHPFHLMTLATTSADTLPQARTVVLRRYDPFRRYLCFHSDIRSKKIDDLRKHPHASLLFYSAEDRLQLRLKAKTEIFHQDDVAASRWEQTQIMSKLCYLSEHAPGHAFAEEEIVTLEKPRTISNAEDALAYSRFTVVRCHFYEIDITELRAQGNVRLKLTWNLFKKLQVQNLAP
jgi:pyridoxine/pyridoxamine 5'-phosphate oxidase